MNLRVMQGAQLFHVGMVTDDIDLAMASLSNELGLRWKGGRPVSMELWVYGQQRTLDMRIAHSIQGSPHIELIQHQSDTPWVTKKKTEMHHLCYWSENSLELCDSLLEKKYTRVLGEPGSDSGYFQGQDGLLIEIINVSLYQSLSEWLAK